MLGLSVGAGVYGGDAQLAGRRLTAAKEVQHQEWIQSLLEWSLLSSYRGVMVAKLHAPRQWNLGFVSG